MSIERQPYLIALWNNGAMVRTDHWAFQSALDELTKQNGPPDKVEYRSGQPEQQTA